MGGSSIGPIRGAGGTVIFKHNEFSGLRAVPGIPFSQARGMMRPTRYHSYRAYDPNGEIDA